MNSPKVIRPAFPPGYVEKTASFLKWEWVAERLTESKIYWLCSVRPPSSAAQGGRPHVVPRWGAFLDGKVYYDGSPETRHARNIESNPYVAVHLENGNEAIILEGTAAPVGKPSPELGKKVSQAYRKKYKADGYAPKPNQWDEGGMYVFIPRQCIAWTNMPKDPTKFVFEGESNDRKDVARQGSNGESQSLS